MPFKSKKVLARSKGGSAALAQRHARASAAVAAERSALEGLRALESPACGCESPACGCAATCSDLSAADALSCRPCGDCGAPVPPDSVPQATAWVRDELSCSLHSHRVRARVSRRRQFRHPVLSWATHIAHNLGGWRLWRRWCGIAPLDGCTVVPAPTAFMLAPLLLRQVHVQLATLLRRAKSRLLTLDSQAVEDVARRR